MAESAKKIFLTISDEKTRTEITKVLVEGGYEVSSNAFAENIIEQVKGYSPDLLFLDSPVIQSLGSKLRYSFPSKPILAWSGTRDVKLAIDLISAGALDCLHPPIRYHEIHAVVRHLLNATIAKDSPLPLPHKNYWPLIQKALIGIGAAVILAGLILFSGYRASKILTFSLTFQNPTGVYWSKKHLWASDWYTQSVYEYKAGGAIKLLKIYSFPEFNPNSLAIINDRLWVTGTDGFVRSYEIINSVPTLTTTIKTAGYSPSGICLENGNLWIVDAETNKIYQHSLSSPEQLVETYDYPGMMPVGFYWDGKFFWSADGKTNKIYKHLGPDRQFEIVASFAVVPEGGGMIAGMSGDGRNFWLIFTSQPAKLMRYPMKRFK